MKNAANASESKPNAIINPVQKLRTLSGAISDEGERMINLVRFTVP